jgi:hypothetical protein
MRSASLIAMLLLCMWDQRFENAEDDASDCRRNRSDVGRCSLGALMARYFFHIKGGAGLIEDEEGSEFETAEDARTAAIRSLREIFAASVKSGADGPVVDAILIADESGQELVLLPLAEVLPRWFQIRMRAVRRSK